MAPSTSSFSRCVTCSAKSADNGSASWRRSALASLARWRSSSRRMSSRSRTALVSTLDVPPGKQPSGGPLGATALLEPCLHSVEGLDELHPALALELLCDGLEVDVEPLECLARIAALGDVPLEPQLRPPEAPIGSQRLEWHGVDRLRHDQLLDILHRAVARILRRGRRPQQPLRARPALREALPLSRRDRLLEDLVRAAGTGDRRLAAQRARRGLAAGGERVEQSVDGRVDAAEEEARDRGERLERLTRRGACL